jgi:uncharacterized membrane protein
MSKARFEAFSDGVFAFAITLLVLGFVLPEARVSTNAELTAKLLALWPSALAYVLSFAVIGIMWQNHQAIMRLVERVDRTTVFWNLGLMAGTAFIPFATNAIGQYPAMKASAFLYGITLVETAICFNGMLAHLARTNSFKKNVSNARIGATRRLYLFGFGSYTAAMVVSLVWPVASLVAYVGIALAFLIPRGVDDDITDTD